MRPNRDISDQANRVSPDRWYREGFFSSENLAHAMARGAASRPASKMVFYSEANTVGATLEDLHTRSTKLAGALYRIGIRRNDTIAIQVPNWIEGTLLYQAAMILGAVVLPIIHIYGPQEVRYILNASKAKALIVPDRWRNIDYLERVDRLGAIPHLKHLIVIGKDAPKDAVSWQQLTDRETTDFPKNTAYADDVCTLLFTSGTTADPKGVLHTHNTLLAEIRASAFAGLQNPASVTLSPWPSGHIAGVLGILRLYVLGVSSVLMDVWNAEAAARLIETYKVTSTSGTPFFLTSLLDAAHAIHCDLSSLDSYLVGAASVPPSLVERCDAQGFATFRSYGSSEHPTISSGEVSDPIAKRAYTDGRLTPGTDVRVVDDRGVDLPTGSEGEIVSMGPEQFIGYHDDALNESSFLPGGWFKTGDIGRVDEDGFLTVTDRKKDIIIRGGENISSKEIEDILTKHEAVCEAAATAMPDKRLGEKVCAFVILKEGRSLSLDDVGAHFRNEGVARQKTPERLVIVRQLPRTAAGKVKKFELRASLK